MIFRIRIIFKTVASLDSFQGLIVKQILKQVQDDGSVENPNS